MSDIPVEILDRLDVYCRLHSVRVHTRNPRGWGMDGYIWQTTADTILKVYYNQRQFIQELAIYERLSERRINRLQGFDVPQLIGSDPALLVLELSYVRPPFVLDFAAAGLDEQPPGFDPDSPGWNAEKQVQFGRRWPEVVRLLDALRHIGIHYTDVHPRNICFDIGPTPRPDAADSPS